jgi:3-oxoacyl-[acyl-carrier-protein] synthase II
MEPWQRIGTYTAGLALADAGLAGKPELLDHTGLVVAAGSGERDTTVDRNVLEKLGTRNDTDVLAKEILPSALRPTLFLAQLSNLLAGNISIVHNVTGSSRTFMGEEMAGISAVENAFRRIQHGQGEVFVVGGACNAEREDLMLGYELGLYLWRGQFRPVWQRGEQGGGFVLGSVGAFLVMEGRPHAEARGAKPYARLRGVLSDRGSRCAGETRATLGRLLDRALTEAPGRGLAVLSGASGVDPITAEELDVLRGLTEGEGPARIRGFGTVLGHSVEAHFPAGLALAALAASRGAFYPRFDASGIEADSNAPASRILVTSIGHWRGEGLGLVEPV